MLIRTLANGNRHGGAGASRWRVMHAPCAPAASLLASAVAALTLLLATPSAEAQGAGYRSCREGEQRLFLQHGITSVAARRVTCRRAVRTLSAWGRAGMPGHGPRGWRCRTVTAGAEDPHDRFACSRGSARIRFERGG